MASLTYAFEVPDTILHGLNTGIFERVGGVIRSTANKQIVTWLRDSSQTNIASNSFPAPLNQIVNAARATGAIAGVNQQAASISNHLIAITALNNFIAAGQVLNFGLTAVSLYIMLQKLNQLSDQINQLEQSIQNEFKRERDMRFKIALQAARDVFESDQSAYRDHAARSAIDGLYEATENFLTDFDTMLKTNSPNRILFARHYFLRALYAETSRIRCYLIANEIKTARKRLTEDMPRFQEAASRLVTELLGAHPALFFYKEVPDEILYRFFQLQHWILSPNEMGAVSREAAMFTAVNQVRPDFWVPEVIQDVYGNPLNQIARRPDKTLADKLAELPDAVAEAEMIVENYQRLLGFELELAGMRLSFDEWQNLIPEAEIQEHGFGLIIDEEAVNMAIARLAS